MATLFLHVGTSKAGSTALQEFLSHNPGPLAAHGLAYGPAFPGSNHLELATAFSTRSTRVARDLGVGDASARRRLQRSLGRRFERAVDDDARWILSSEHLGTLLTRSEDIATLAGFLRRYFDRIVVVVVLRRIGYWLPSAYVESVRGGSTKLLDADYVEQRRRLLDHRRLLRRWEDGFGPDQTGALPFLESDRTDASAFCFRVLSALGLGQPDHVAWSTPPQVSNESMSAYATEVLRSANPVLRTSSAAACPRPAAGDRVHHEDMAGAPGRSHPGGCAAAADPRARRHLDRPIPVRDRHRLGRMGRRAAAPDRAADRADRHRTRRGPGPAAPRRTDHRVRVSGRPERRGTAWGRRCGGRGSASAVPSGAGSGGARMDLGWPELLALLTSIGYGVVSAMVPLINAEAFIVASQVTAVAGAVPVAIGVAIGQTIGKVAMFYGVRRGRDLPVVRNKRAERLARPVGPRTLQVAGVRGPVAGAGRGSALGPADHVPGGLRRHPAAVRGRPARRRHPDERALVRPRRPGRPDPALRAGRVRRRLGRPAGGPEPAPDRALRRSPSCRSSGRRRTSRAGSRRASRRTAPNRPRSASASSTWCWAPAPGPRRRCSAGRAAACSR